jgi:biotin carboxylase
LSGAALPTDHSYTDTRIVLEEYLDGQEVDIDLIIQSGLPVFSEVSDNGPTVEPYCGETWVVTPSLLPDSVVDELKEMARRVVVDCLGFTDGVFHVEAKYTTRGEPKLIEVNCRMGGGPMRQIHLERSAVDLVGEQLLISCGIVSRPVTRTDPPAIGASVVNATRSGIVTSLEWLEPFRSLPGLIELRPTVTVGERVVGPEEGQPSWVCDVIIQRDSKEEAAAETLTVMGRIQTEFDKYLN